MPASVFWINKAPSVTLSGASTITLLQGSTYTEQGATCTDPESGTLTPTIAGAVNAGIINTYTLTYSCTDGVNNATPRTRTVNVVSSSAPTGTLTYTPTSGTTTTGNVVVTISGFTQNNVAVTGVTIINTTNNSTSYTFTNNGSFTFQLRDRNGVN